MSSFRVIIFQYSIIYKLDIKRFDKFAEHVQIFWTVTNTTSPKGNYGPCKGLFTFLVLMKHTLYHIVYTDSVCICVCVCAMEHTFGVYYELYMKYRTYE